LVETNFIAVTLKGAFNSVSLIILGTTIEFSEISLRCVHGDVLHEPLQCVYVHSLRGFL
jgi:hypothetical protein